MTREEVRGISADAVLPVKPYIPGAKICGNDDSEDSDYLPKKSDPAPTPGGQETGAIFRTTRNTQVSADGVDLSRLGELRAFHRQKGGDKQLEGASTLVLNEEAGRKIETKSVSGVVSEGKLSSLDKRRQSKVAFATQEKKQPGVDQSENHVEYEGANESANSVFVSRRDRDPNLEDEESELGESILDHDHSPEKLSGGFDDFEDGDEACEGAAIGAKDGRSSGTKEMVVPKMLDASDGGRARAGTEESRAAVSVFPAVGDASDDEGDAPRDITPLHVAVKPGIEVEGTARSSVNKAVGGREKSKSTEEVPRPDDNRPKISHYEETSDFGSGSQGSDFPLVLPLPPPSPLDLAAALGDNEHISPALSSFMESSGSSQQPLSSTGGLSAPSLAEIPLPPVVGARQRLGLLGCLPHGGGESLSTQGGAGGEPLAPDGKSGNTDINGQKSIQQSSGFFSSGARPAADSPPEFHRRSNTSTHRCTEGSQDGERGAPGERLREEDKPKEYGEEKDVDGGISPPESPQQHQGQEEENAGRITESGVDDEPVSVISEGAHNDGGDCSPREVIESFTNSDVELDIEEQVISDGDSTDESLHFEQESDIDDGGRRDDGIDDFFS